jgi:hypothetical protein
MQGGFSSPQPGGFSPPQQQQQQGQQQMPPCVQEFFKLRDDAEKKAAAIKAANERKAPPKEACVLFTALAASQTKMLKFVNENGQWCGIPANVTEQIKMGTAKVAEIRTKVCQVAAAPQRPQGPSLSDALSAPVPDSNNIKTGRGTYDTLDRQPARKQMSDGSGRVADATGNWVDGLAPPFSRPYLRLARLDRPIGSWLLLVPCWWSVGLAGMREGHFPNAWHIVLFFIGAFAMRGAGCTWNDLVDRDLDGLVERTRSRPIPIETGHGRASDHVHACAGLGRIPRADPVQSFHGFDRPRFAPCGRHLSFHEAHYLLAADFPRARLFMGRAHGLAG